MILTCFGRAPSVEFFKQLGFTFDARFTDETATYPWGV
jgi:predicted lactoylglutathione lyase